MRPLRRLVVIPSIGLALLGPTQEAAAKRSGEGGTAGQNSPPKQEERSSKKGYDDRIDKKCLAGALGGVGGGLAGAAIMVGIDDGSFGWGIPALMGFWGGNVVGTAVGVSAVDPHDSLPIALAGSVLGGGRRALCFRLCFPRRGVYRAVIALKCFSRTYCWCNDCVRTMAQSPRGCARFTRNPSHLGRSDPASQRGPICHRYATFLGAKKGYYRSCALSFSPFFLPCSYLRKRRGSVMRTKGNWPRSFLQS